MATTSTNSATNSATITVTNLAELTRKGNAFAGCSLIKTDSTRHPSKGDVKGREFILVPFAKFDGASFANFANLDAVTLPKLGGFAVMLKGTGGKTAKDDGEAFRLGFAELATIPAKVDALRAELGNCSDDTLGELMREFSKAYREAIVKMLARADVLRASGVKITRDTLKPEPKAK